MYKNDTVSYGNAYVATMADGTEIRFVANKVVGPTRLDERNLTHCKYLNLDGSSITGFD